MGFDSMWHWLLVLLVVLLVFGTKKIRNLGPDLGNALRGFRQAMQGEDEAEKGSASGEELRADAPSPQEKTSHQNHDSTSSR